MIRIVTYRDGFHFGIVSCYNAEVYRIAKETPGVSWDAKNRAWVGYLDGIEVVKERLYAEIGTCPEDTTITHPTIGSTLAVSYDGLRDYQKTGVDFLIEHAREGCILADQMALGKSRQAIRAARAFKDKTVIVCPSFARGVWGISALEKPCEVAAGWPKAKVQLLSTTKAKPIDDAIDVVVLHCDILHAWVAELRTWGAKFLILDELHMYANATSRRTQAAIALARTCSYRVGLTGTPMKNRPRDLWAPVDILSPGRFGKFFDFGIRYAAGHQEQVTPERVAWIFSGSSNEEELQKRLGYFMLRRTRADVSIEMPPMTRQIVELEVPRKHIISPAKALGSDKMLRRALDAAADGKIPQIVEIASNYIDAGHKVVVFSYRRAIAAAIANGVKANSVEVVDGGVPQKKRLAIVARKPDLLCATMDSLGMGVSLAYADVAIFAELHYVPSTLLQCEGRLPRPDSKHASVLIIYACARGTGDDLVRRIILSKLSTIQQTVGKTADKLLDDLSSASKESTVTRMRRLYERLLKQNEAQL
jgi:SWI/SNF-related matrix-associated actin-dependent regulator 1 of chromatin subfamily A